MLSFDFFLCIYFIAFNKSLLFARSFHHHRRRRRGELCAFNIFHVREDFLNLPNVIVSYTYENFYFLFIFLFFEFLFSPGFRGRIYVRTNIYYVRAKLILRNCVGSRITKVFQNTRGVELVLLYIYYSPESGKMSVEIFRNVRIPGMNVLRLIKINYPDYVYFLSYLDECRKKTNNPKR